METENTFREAAAQLHSLPADFGHLVGQLARKNPQQNEAAAKALRQMGGSAVTRLVKEAAGPGKQPDHRLRILDVVIAIGEPLGFVEDVHLDKLLYGKVPRVRQKALEVCLLLSPPGPPQSVEDAFLSWDMNLAIPSMALFPRRTKRRPDLEDFCQAADAANRRLGRTGPSLVATLRQMAAEAGSTAASDSGTCKAADAQSVAQQQSPPQARDTEICVMNNRHRRRTMMEKYGWTWRRKI